MKTTRDQLAQAAATCGCSSFRKASRAVTQLYDHILQPSGLRSTQLIIMLEIAIGEPITVSRLARRLVMDSSTVTRNLKPLMKQELINQVAEKNKRSQAIVVTTKGYEALEGAVPLWEKAQSLLAKELGEERWNALLDDLSTATTIARGISEI